MNHNNAKQWRGSELRAFANHGTKGGEFTEYKDAWGNDMIKTKGSHCSAEYRVPAHIAKEIMSNDWKVPHHRVSTRQK